MSMVLGCKDVNGVVKNIIDARGRARWRGERASMHVSMHVSMRSSMHVCDRV